MTDELLTAIATARAFTQQAQAQRTVLILDRPGQEPAMVEVDEWLDAEITEEEHVTTVPHDATIEPPAKPLPPLDPIPATAIDMNLTTGEIAAPIGAVERLADAVLALATAFGGRTVASVEFATNDPETPITFAARAGERVVLGAGDEQFEL